MSSGIDVLVSGATGTQGGAVARELIDRGHRVRALTRNPRSAAATALAGLGAEVVAGDFDDSTSLHAASKGVDAAFVMGTPFGTDPQTETRQAIALVDATRAAGVAQIVYTSVASALDGTGVPHFESKAVVERHLDTIDDAHTVVAPAAFLGDLTAPWMLASLQEGRYGFPLPGDVTLQQVAVPDVAAFVALVLEHPDRFAGRRVELASVAATGEQVAARLSTRLGRTIEYQETPIDIIREQLGDDGVKMLEFFRRDGYTVDIPSLRRAYPEVGWHDLDDWIDSHDWSLLG